MFIEEVDGENEPLVNSSRVKKSCCGEFCIVGANEFDAELSNDEIMLDEDTDLLFILIKFERFTLAIGSLALFKLNLSSSNSSSSSCWVFISSIAAMVKSAIMKCEFSLSSGLHSQFICTA